MTKTFSLRQDDNINIYNKSYLELFLASASSSRNKHTFSIGANIHSCVECLYKQ